MNLTDTVELMGSDDFSDKLKVEYLQTSIRYEELKNMLNNFEVSEDGSCDYLKNGVGLLRYQSWHMLEYLKILEVRAALAGIALTKPLPESEE